MHSQSVTFCRWRSAVLVLGEAGGNHCTRSQRRTAADVVSRKTFFSHLYKCLPKKNQCPFNCTLNLGFFPCFNLPSDSHSFWHCFFFNGMLLLQLAVASAKLHITPQISFLTQSYSGLFKRRKKTEVVKKVLNLAYSRIDTDFFFR